MSFVMIHYNINYSAMDKSILLLLLQLQREGTVNCLWALPDTPLEANLLFIKNGNLLDFDLWAFLVCNH